MLKAGTIEKTITPEIGIELCGYLARIQPSVACYDELYAKVLYVENAGARVIWIHCDLIGFSNEIASRIRKSVSDKTALKINDVFLSATHNHAGPATVRLRKCGDIDLKYMDFLERSIIEGAVAAVRDAETVTLRSGEAAVEHIAVDRRPPSKNSHVDTKLPVLAFCRNDGSFKAIITNYAMHNVGLSSNNRSISADIAGFAAKFATSRISGKPTIFLTNGGCGNVNPAIIRDDYSGVEYVGTILGNAIIQAATVLKPCTEDCIESRFSEFDLPLDTLSTTQLEKIIEKDRLSHSTLDDSYEINRLHRVLNIWYEETRYLLANKQAPHSISAKVHILQIGPVTFVGINAEVFSKMAEQLRQTTGFESLYVVGYADGCIGYLAPLEIHREGGYEINEAYKYYGFFGLKAGGFEMIRDKVQTMLNQKQKYAERDALKKSNFFRAENIKTEFS